MLHNLATLLIFCPIFTSHLVKISLFLPQLNIQFVLNLKDLTLLMLLQVSLVMVDVGAMLLAELLEPTFEVFLSVLLNLGDISRQLLLLTFNLKELVVLDLALLLADLDLLVKCLLNMHETILLLLLHLELVLIKLIHDPTLHLFCLKLQVLPDKFLLL